MSPVRLGMLTPSSNTVLEPVTYGLIAGMPDVTVHFARFEVVEISLASGSAAQFSDGPILEAARLLSHAKCHSITWNGTSASWLGFDRDEHLVSRIEATTGIPAATCVLAYRQHFRAFGFQRIGLVTPYTSDVQRRIRDNFGKAGIPCSAERHAGLTENFAFAEVSDREIEAMTRAVIAEGCDAAAIVCTNMNGAGIARRISHELKVPVLDSVVVALSAALSAAGQAVRAQALLAEQLGASLKTP